MKNLKIVAIGQGGGHIVEAYSELYDCFDDIIYCETDKQVHDRSKIKNKLLIGEKLTKGLGSGSLPEVGEEAAILSKEQIINTIGKDTELVILVSGLGGGTGSGATPIITKLCCDLNILTLNLATLPYSFEGKKRSEQAEKSLNEIRNHSDAVIVHQNNKLIALHGNMKMSEAFEKSNNYCASLIKSLTNFMMNDLSKDTKENVKDFKKLGFLKAGVATAGTFSNIAQLVEDAFDDLEIDTIADYNDAKFIFLDISMGEDDLNMDHIGEIGDTVQERLKSNTKIIMSYSTDNTIEFGIRLVILVSDNKNAFLILNKSEERLKEEKIKIAQARIRKLKEITQKMKSPEGFLELEKHSSFRRININQAKKDNSLKLYFNLSEYHPDEIADIISMLSMIYKTIGGDELEIVGMRKLEFIPEINPVEV